MRSPRAAGAAREEEPIAYSISREGTVSLDAVLLLEVHQDLYGTLEVLDVVPSFLGKIRKRCLGSRTIILLDKYAYVMQFLNRHLI